jgi:hypothetical protein
MVNLLFAVLKAKCNRDIFSFVMGLLSQDTYPTSFIHSLAQEIDS